MLSNLTFSLKVTVTGYTVLSTVFIEDDVTYGFGAGGGGAADIVTFCVVLASPPSPLATTNVLSDPPVDGKLKVLDPDVPYVPGKPDNELDMNTACALVELQVNVADRGPTPVLGFHDAVIVGLSIGAAILNCNLMLSDALVLFIAVTVIDPDADTDVDPLVVIGTSVI